MASEVEICNMALGRIGEDPILSFDDGDKASDLCRDNWESVRDVTLKAIAPSCAVRRTTLVRSVDTPAWGWDYQYVLPTGYLKLLSPSSSESSELYEVEGYSPSFKYEIEDGKLLCNDEGPIGIKYVFRQVNTTKYDATTVEAMVLAMASVLAWSLRNIRSLSESLMGQFKELVADASGQSTRERTDLVEEDTDFNWITSRY